MYLLQKNLHNHFLGFHLKNQRSHNDHKKNQGQMFPLSRYWLYSDKIPKYLPHHMNLVLR